MSPPSPTASLHDDIKEDYRVSAHSLEPPTPEEAKIDRRIVLKTDAVVLVLITLVATFEFLDKNGLAYAAVWGLKKDTGLVGQQYSTVATVFYAGYLVALFPCMYLVNKLPIGKFIGGSVIGWGITVMCMAACHNFAGLVVVRVILGIFEASILPCFMVLSSVWWKRSEQALRTALWYNTLAGVFGGILSYAIGHLDGTLAVWKYLFLIYGSVTVFLGVLVVFLLPDSPQTAWFLSPTEKDRSLIRLAGNQQGKASKKFNPSHVLEALKQPQYWIIALFVVAQSITNAGVTNFNPLIISGFGFSQARTTLMATPQAAVALVAQITFSFIALYVRNVRCILWFISCLPALIGAVLIRVLDHETQRAGALVGVYLMGFYNVSWVLVLSLATSNNAGTSKKVFQSCSIAIFYSVGNLIGPSFFRSSQAPTYSLGIFAMMVCFAFMAACSIAYFAVVYAENKRRDARFGQGGITQEGLEELEQADPTDVQNAAFRYSY